MVWLDAVPLAVIAPLILIALLAAAAAGYSGHRWLMKRRGENDPDSHDHLLAAILGLLALLLGFTFSLALNRYETRRELVVQEANALGTTWLRAQLLEPANKAAISGLLRDYLDVRLAWSEAGAVPQNDARTEELQHKLWVATGRVVRSDPSPQLSRALMDAMNESFDLASTRSATRSAHVPDRVLDVLLLYALLSAAMLGYASAAKGKPQRIATSAVMVLLTLAMTMILDIDRPRGGAIQVSQQPLEELKRAWR
jgi:hypothetical protein